MGFGICFSLGYLIAFFSFRFFIKLIEGNPLPFAFNYSFGHISQLLASTFLCGPKRQFRYVNACHAGMSPLLPGGLPILYATVQYFSTLITFTFIVYRSMFDEKRRITSIVYLSCLGSTLVIVFLPLPSSLKLITLLLLTVTQFSASVWYTMSYVPYGRRTLLRFFKYRLGLEESDYANVTLGG
jgi:hypothetical protein